jgi:hypothetical protein
MDSVNQLAGINNCLWIKSKFNFQLAKKLFFVTQNIILNPNPSMSQGGLTHVYVLNPKPTLLMTSLLYKLGI